MHGHPSRPAAAAAFAPDRVRRSHLPVPPVSLFPGVNWARIP